MKNNILFYLIILLFILTGISLKTLSTETRPSKQNKLNQLSNKFLHWYRTETIPMDDKIINTLELDDYYFGRFTNGEENITLYIGYYHTAKKVGAAHDPMVCFPGQGWKITNTSKGVYKIPYLENSSLNYSTITANLGEQNEHILYWFQAHEKTASNTFLQKLFLLQSTIIKEGQDNAFVRLSIPCQKMDIDKCEKYLLDFSNEFYPNFLKFINLP